MLELLFGNQNTERILFSLLNENQCYAKALADRFSTALYGVQSTLLKLEKAGILVSFKQGQTRLFQFNPRYPFLKELKDFLAQAYRFLPEETREQYYEQPVRKRPRRSGKPHRYVRD